MRGTVYLILTSKCNLKCPFCFYVQDPLRVATGTLNLQRLTKLIEEAKDLDFNEVSFTGGEPLLYPGLCQLIKLSQSLGLKTDLATNGSLLNQHEAVKLRKAGLDHLYLSTTSQYLFSTDVQKWKDKIIAITSLLKKAGLKNITLVFVITPQSVAHLNPLLRISRELDVDIQLQPAYIVSRSSEFSLHKLDEAKWQKIETVLKKWVKQSGRIRTLRTFLGFYERLKCEYKPTSCHFCREDIVIDSNGNIYPCFHRLDLKLGNIYKDKLKNAIGMLSKKDQKEMEYAKCFGEHCMSLF